MNKEISAAPLACNVQIDYTNVGDAPILPFVVELDPENSLLEPGADENQRFCYQITGVGQDIPFYSDLSHFTLGICSEILETDITNIQVSIDEIPQSIEFQEGGTVEFKQQMNPDNSEEESGLRFNYNLNKAGQIMTVSFELKQPYAIGPISLSLYGQDVLAAGLTICGPVPGRMGTCPSTVYQFTRICVPVKVYPYATAKTACTFCCGTPVISSGSDKCCGETNGTCTFTVSQKVCIAVPIRFGANALAESFSVVCSNPSDHFEGIAAEEEEIHDSNSSQPEKTEDPGEEEPSDTAAAPEPAAQHPNPHTERSDVGNIKNLFNPYFRKKL